MKKSKLLDICQALKPEEWRLLIDFVSSPYFNKQEPLIRFCQHLQELAKKGFPPASLQAAVIWQALFPAAPFVKKQLAYMMSDLLKLIEAFLGQQLAAHSAESEIAVLRALSERKLGKNYAFRLQKLKDKVAAAPQRDADYFHLSYTIASMEDEYFNAQNLRQENPYFLPQNEAIDQYYLQSKLRLFCNMLNEAGVIGSSYQLNWPEDPRTAAIKDHENQVVQTYQCLFKMLQQKDPDELLFNQYNQLLTQIKDQTSDNELISLYYFAINYCLSALKKGYRDYADKLLNLYQTGLSSDNLLVNGELSPWIYKNIVKLSLGLKQFDWVENFILDYTEKLPANDRHDALYFNLSDLKYHQKEYDEALAHLNKVEFSDIFYKHGTKIMLLKIYFEKQETEAFLNLASSYKLMLLREKGLSGNTLNAYKNFVRLAVKLFKVDGGNQSAIEKLKEEIKRTKNINARQWLLEQVKGK